MMSSDCDVVMSSVRLHLSFPQTTLNVYRLSSVPSLFILTDRLPQRGHPNILGIVFLIGLYNLRLLLPMYFVRN